VNLAARGVRNLDTGEEKIGNQEEIAILRRQARKVYIESAVFAGLATVGYCLFAWF
jgi:hypothetical protein